MPPSAEVDPPGSGPADTVIVRPRPDGVPRDLGRPTLPRSKSHAQRALLVAGLGAGALRIENLPDADDVAVLRAALVALGASIDDQGEDAIRVTAAPALVDADVACGENGTALRTLLVAVGLLGGRARFQGGPRLQVRPLEAVRGVLARIGVSLSADWPVRLVAPPALALPARLTVDASTSTQPATGAILGMACRAARGLATVPVEIANATAAGYVALTIDVLETLGFGVRADDGEIEVCARSSRSASYRVPDDASAVAFPVALAALHGHPIDALTPARRDRHPDWGVLDDVRRLVVAAPDESVEIDDLGRRPDTFPALCAVAAARPGPTSLRGAPALRGKESDRITAMSRGLRPLGVRCEELANGLVVHGRTEFEAGEDEVIRLPAPPDHRVVMALALLGTRCRPGVRIDNARAVAKSWPGYFTWLARVADVR